MENKQKSLDSNKQFINNKSDSELNNLMVEFDNYESEEPEKDIIMELKKDPTLKEFDDKVTENISALKQKQETLELLEVPMPIQNKSISIWNKSNTNPNFDGEYLCYIRCREECGNVHSYYKVVSNSFNTWLINKNERIALWKELPKNPFND